MLWQLDYAPEAAKELAKLDKGVARDVKRYLAAVCQLSDPASRGHPLTGPWAGFHRYRLGQVRLIVEIKRSHIVLLVVKVARRDSAY